MSLGKQGAVQPDLMVTWRDLPRLPGRAVYNNRSRHLSGVARVALTLRPVLCERAFAHILDCGGMRRTWLRGPDNVVNFYLHASDTTLLFALAIDRHGRLAAAAAILITPNDPHLSTGC